jgi:hypothetical protein
VNTSRFYDFAQKQREPPNQPLQLTAAKSPGGCLVCVYSSRLLVLQAAATELGR